jgi:hypothetical protein
MYGGALRDSDHDAVWNKIDGGVCEVTCCKPCGIKMDEAFYALSKLRETQVKDLRYISWGDRILHTGEGENAVFQ